MALSMRDHFYSGKIESPINIILRKILSVIKFASWRINKSRFLKFACHYYSISILYWCVEWHIYQNSLIIICKHHESSRILPVFRLAYYHSGAFRHLNFMEILHSIADSAQTEGDYKKRKYPRFSRQKESQSYRDYKDTNKRLYEKE